MTADQSMHTHTHNANANANALHIHIWLQGAWRAVTSWFPVPTGRS